MPRWVAAVRLSTSPPWTRTSRPLSLGVGLGVAGAGAKRRFDGAPRRR